MNAVSHGGGDVDVLVKYDPHAGGRVTDDPLRPAATAPR